MPGLSLGSTSLFGGKDTVRHPDRESVRGDLIPIVLHTTDGGATWTNVTESAERLFPQGEWCWKFQIIEDTTIVIANQNYRDGAILRSDDRGETWARLRINDRQRNSNLEGIGFLDTRRGWVGGWGDLDYEGGFTSESNDGGNNWDNANHVGFRLNRFRVIGEPPRVIYASGDRVYKFSNEPVLPAVKFVQQADAARHTVEAKERVRVDVEVQAQTERLTVRIWERFGLLVKTLVDESAPTAGARTIEWDFTDDAGRALPPSSYIMRITTDDRSESRMIFRMP